MDADSKLLSRLQPRTARSYVMGHVLIGMVFLVGVYSLLVWPADVGSDLARRRAVIERQRPELVLVGNSLLRAAIDADEFSALSGHSTVVASSNGSSSLWWYLYIKNVITQTSHRPRYVGIMFRDAFLTEPEHRVTGNYQKPIRQLMADEEELADELSYGGMGLNHIHSVASWAPREARNWLNFKIEKRVEDLCNVQRGQGRVAFRRVFAAENMVTDLYDEYQLQYETVDSEARFDFSRQVERSYLPEILRLLKRANITPVFVRAKRRRDLVPDSHPAELRQYIGELRDYLSDQGALWIDFTDEARITVAHFGPGDHLDRTQGRALFSRLLTDQLVPVMADRKVTRPAVTR